MRPWLLNRFRPQVRFVICLFGIVGSAADSVAQVGPDGCSWEANFAILVELGLALGNNLNREISECISMVLHYYDIKVVVSVYSITSGNPSQKINITSGNCPSFGWVKAR